MARAGGGASRERSCAYLDADTAGFSAHYAIGLLGPLVCVGPGDRGVADEVSEEITGGEIAFVKAFYKRPFEHGGVSLPEGGGRVNHLLARPALRLFYPQLAAVSQPLAGEVAARRELLERVPFATGYGVEIGMLIDVWREVGMEGIAQVDLEEHRNRHQPLSALDADGADGARDDRTPGAGGGADDGRGDRRADARAPAAGGAGRASRAGRASCRSRRAS